MFLQNILAILY